MKHTNLICLFLIYTIWLSLFTPFFTTQTEDLIVQQNTEQEEQKGLQFRLREDSILPEKKEEAILAETANLSEAETNALLRRLPQMNAERSDESDFVMRPGSSLPPKTGNVISAKFPAQADQSPPAVNPNSSAALEAVRFTPEGQVSLASDLSVTFSQPMVAVASQTRAAENAPIKLAPQPRGKWRWVGTKTLVFDAEARFPMATKFTATIPAGTKSVGGSSLKKEVSWTFSTPPPAVTSFEPNGATVKRDALLTAVFNQEIDPDAVLQKVIASSNNEKISLRLASENEIAADQVVSDKIKNLQPKRFMVFRATELLPTDSQINVTFEAGTPSSEGELTTTAPQSYSFKTFGTLKFAKSYCGYDRESKVCAPSESLRVEFNNDLDKESFDRSQVKIEPDIEGAEISVSGDSIEIYGYKKPRTDYRVIVAGTLKDKFGQSLGQDVTATFKIDEEEPNLFTQSGNKEFVVLDPDAKPAFSVYSTNYPNLKVKLYKVRAEDYHAFRKFKPDEDQRLPSFGKLVFDKTIRIKDALDEQTETRIDLSPALTNGFGHAVLIVEPLVPKRDNERERIIAWLEATQIGIDGFADYEQLTVFASDLKTGRPLSNVQISLSNGASGATGENGIVNLAFPSSLEKRSGLLIARKGDDTAILPEPEYYAEHTRWTRKPEKDSLRWFVFNDRNLYRIGEMVSVKGYVRRIAGGKFADIQELTGAASLLNYVLSDSRGNEVSRGSANLNAFGAFDFQLRLPEGINLGSQSLTLSTNSDLENKSFTHNFQVQEFRRPEFEVSANVEPAAPFFVGNSSSMSVEAKYYSGGGLPNAETNWKVTAKPTVYTPPNRDDFTFGKFVPWWQDRYEGGYEETTSRQFKGVTDLNGKHRIALDFISANPARPYTINAEAAVQDVNRQTFAASTSLLVHPSKLYVGLRSGKNFVQSGDRFIVETIATDIDGNAIAGAPVLVIAELEDWQQIKGEWQQVTIDTQSCQIRSQQEATPCSFTAKQGGVYTIKASVLDERERRNESELTIWVAGGQKEPKRDVEQEEAELIPDKEEYSPGDTAEILVNAPFFPAEGVLTLRRGGIIKTERFTMQEASTVLRIPIEERFLPNVHVQVDLTGAAQRIAYEDERDKKLPKRPAFASAQLNLNVSTASRELKVTAEPVVRSLKPGGETTINVAVKDNNGSPAADTEIALVAVDESVLALTDYKISNPLRFFYQQIEANTADYHSRENVLLADPEDIGRGFGNGYGSGNGDGDGSPPSIMRPQPVMMARMETQGARKELPTSNPSGDINSIIPIRRNFDALAIFAPSVRTDKDGKAVVNVKLPDNLTRYRITAVAVTSSKQFGKGEANITAKQSLMVRPSPPRFMNFGDRIELPVVLQNQTDDLLTVNVAVRSVNAHLTNGSGKRVVIPANDRAEVRFDVTADKAGTARFQIGAVSGELADAAEFEFPVYTPATSESFATYGTIDQNGAVVQPIEIPSDVYSQFGNLEITTSSTQLQELTDAFIYLQNYPFECSEQISSRILSVAALRDVLTAFDARELPSKSEIEAKMKSDLERLAKLQHADGGFSFWRSDDASVPYVSAHVAHALARAVLNGYVVPRDITAKSRLYLQNIESKYPAYYSRESRLAISAYALYVRDLFGEKDAAKARQILKDAGAEKLSPESLGWLLSVLANDKDSGAEVDSIKRHLFNRVTETAAAANFTTDYSDGEYVLLASDRRTDAVVLEALLKVEPNNDLIPKIARGLLAGKRKGRWANTQENVFILLALDKYFKTYETVTPDFVARVWLGQAFAGEQKFEGRSTDSNSVNVPMKYLQEQKGKNDLILDKQGAGRLYYRIGLNYAPKNLKLDAADYGFSVMRTYEAIDDARDVKKNADGSWTIKAGARVAVKLQMAVPARRYHVALVDKLPAGFEIINPALAVSGTMSENPNDRPPVFGYGYRSIWFEHQNLRDERAEAFASLLREGVWSYSYVVRATTPGNFVAPPAKAEEMYSPETFGRTSTDFINVE